MHYLWTPELASYCAQYCARFTHTKDCQVTRFTANCGWVHNACCANFAEQPGCHNDCIETTMVPVTKTLYKRA